jgi:hypothetical protein
MSGISTAAGDASISSGMRHQYPLDPSPFRKFPETGMHSKDNEHQGALMDQGRELPARETSGHASENHHQLGMRAWQGGHGIVEEMPIELYIRALKAHNLHDVDEVVLMCLRLCVEENCFFMSVCVIKSVHACFVWHIHLPTNVRDTHAHIQFEVQYYHILVDADESRCIHSDQSTCIHHMHPSIHNFTYIIRALYFSRCTVLRADSEYVSP